MTIEVAYLQGDGTGPEHSAHLMRQIQASLSSAGVGKTNGADDLLVTQDTGSNMKIKAAKGVAMVQGTDVADQGLYGFMMDASVTKDIAASDPSDDRIDAVVAQVRDTFYGGAADDGRIQVITGTPDPAPDPPDIPDSSLLLAYVSVGAGVTQITNADISDERVVMGGVGGGGKTLRASLGIGGSNFPVPNNVDTSIQWDSVIEDVGTWYDVAHPTRLTAPVDCIVIAGVQIAWGADTGGDRRGVKITQGNGQLKRAHDQGIQPNGGWDADNGPVSGVVSRPLNMSAGDYIEARAYQNSGGSLNIANDNGESVFWVVVIG